MLNNRTLRGLIQPYQLVALFTLFVGIACLVLMFVVLDRGEQRAIREQEDRAKLLVHALENSVIRSFRDVIGRLNSVEEALIQNPGLLMQDDSELSSILQDLLPLTPSLREVVVHDANGNWVASSRQPPPELTTVAAKCGADLLLQQIALEYLIQPPRNGRFLGSVANRNGQQHIPLCLQVRDSAGQPLAIVTGVINPDYFKELFRPAYELNPVVLELFQYNGSYLLRGAGADNRISQQNHTKDLFSSRLQNQQFGTYHQQYQPLLPAVGTPIRVITSYRSTSQLPLVMMVHLDLEKGLQSWSQDARLVFWIFMALIAAIAMGGSVLMIALFRKYRMESEILLLTAAISSIANAVFITDHKGRIEWVNRAFESLTGWLLDDVRGKTPRILNSGSHDDYFFQQLWGYILEGKVWRGQVINRSRDRQNIIIDQTITPIQDQFGKITHFVSVQEDVTARTEAEQRIRFLARHDVLTSLPNRRSFVEQLGAALEKAGSNRLAIMFIDLDHFKTINDTLGHQAGDEVLRITTSRMSEILSGNAALARLGGDEFAVLLNGIANDAEVQQLVENLLQALCQPVQLDSSSFTLSASIGVTFGLAGSDDVSTLLRQADLAMYKAKQNGRNTFSFFDENMDYVMHRYVELEQGMRAALNHEGSFFCLSYQPVIDSDTLKPVSVEVLMRWQTNSGEWISPAEFIPVAEDVGLIIELGRWQLNELFRRLLEWKQSELKDLQVSINISAVQLARDNIAEVLVAKMLQAGIRSDDLVIEVTETTLMTESIQLRDNLTFLHDNGVRLSIDDFGTGYSSLSYISELDASLIKIDRSFVTGIGNKQSDEAIIMATIALARSLDIKVVAEGVEDEQQLEFLLQAGVDYLQGYYFAKPMFEEQLIEYMAGTSRNAAFAPAIEAPELN